MSLHRRILEALEPYVPGEQPSSRRVIKLNTNENPYPQVPAVLDALRAMDGEALRRYPPPACDGLVTRLAHVYGFPTEGIMVGNGSDEVLALVARAFLDPGDVVVVTDPTYLLYGNIILLHGGEPLVVPLAEGFHLPPAIYEVEGKLLFLASPNSPNGASFGVPEVERLSDSFPGLIVVDEAYADFAEHDCLDLARRRDNVLVVRTFSKAFSLASLRIGFALGRPEVVRFLHLVKDSYNVNLAAQSARCAALDSIDEVRRRIETIRSERERMRGRLSEMGFDAFESDANFFLFRTPRAREIYETLKSEGIFIRFINKPGLDDCLRVTVGTPQQNDAYLEAMARVHPPASGM